MNEEAKKLILNAKNICIIPSKTNEAESLPSALALFYTLRDLGKNVNLLNEVFPEKLQFLIPSLDFLSQPKNFVISIPRNTANVSQIYYEKNDENLKIHLTVENSNLKKEHIAFYFEQPKPDLVITLSVTDFQKELAQNLDSFGFLLGAPIINIDNGLANTAFGNINMVRESSIAEIVMDITGRGTNSKEVANCLLVGMVAHYENFKNPKTKPETLKIAADLMERGANYQQITENLYTTTPQQMEFLTEIFKQMRHENSSYVAELSSEQFWNFGEPEATSAMEKISTLGLQNNLLVLWKSHASDPMIKGFFYSKNVELLNAVQGKTKNGWVFLEFGGSDTGLIKEKLLKLM